jgi:hypothetical protein
MKSLLAALMLFNTQLALSQSSAFGVFQDRTDEPKIQEQSNMIAKPGIPGEWQWTKYLGYTR